MCDQPKRPSGLSSDKLERLEKLMRHCHGFSPENLLQMAYSHLDDIQGIRVQQPEIESTLAEAIFHVIDRVASDWNAFSPLEQSWLRAGIEYFSKSDDEQPDLGRDGFQDDLEVFNACLRFVGREEWTLDANDFSG